MVATGKVAKKRALYPPKKMMEDLGLEEGQPIKYRIENHRLVVEPIKDPIDLALAGKKWAKATVREFERESKREQQGLYD